VNGKIFRGFGERVTALWDFRLYRDKASALFDRNRATKTGAREGRGKMPRAKTKAVRGVRRWNWWDWTKHILWIIWRTFELLLMAFWFVFKWVLIAAAFVAFGLLIFVGVWFAQASERNMRKIERLND
jgi:hypothetical protein